MVRNLVLKDFYTQKIHVYLTGLLWFIIFTNFFTDGSPIRHVLLLTFLAYWFAISTDYSTKSTENDQSILVNSLPVTRRQVVLAKFLSGFMWFLLATVLVVVYVFLFNTFAPFLSRMMSIGELLLALSAFYILLAIFYPLHFTVGYRIASILAGVLPLIAYLGLQIVINMINNPRLTYMDDFVAFIENYKTIIIIIFVVTSAVITLLSYAASVRIYAKKDF